MAHHFPERRAVPREALRVPVHWDDGRFGWTRDISPEGAYVLVRGVHVFHRWCALEIGFRQAGLRFRALAQVLRVEHEIGGTGIALRLRAPRFYALR
ncbi:hypothetical protein [Ramlibacter humi]|uniref:PilZ domain-containing protein n=1 Tax=Ramlibacter humi TaxID=2530451 RepID=A0A4Z0BLK1_9BURK|nr:hypothetical protein [Ramlibacter humi]TFZ00207.1 hypothetical protein EZ216_13965 [Ramlibacter humi]